MQVIGHDAVRKDFEASGCEELWDPSSECLRVLRN